jgi:hypothetical protein
MPAQCRLMLSKCTCSNHVVADLTVKHLAHGLAGEQRILRIMQTLATSPRTMCRQAARRCGIGHQLLACMGSMCVMDMHQGSWSDC